MTRQAFVGAALLAALALAAPGAAALDDPARATPRGLRSAPGGADDLRGAPRLLRAPGAELSSDDAAALVRDRTGSRVLGVRRHDGRYRVRVLTPGGRVRTLDVDARSGRLR